MEDSSIRIDPSPPNLLVCHSTRGIVIDSFMIVGEQRIDLAVDISNIPQQYVADVLNYLLLHRVRIMPGIHVQNLEGSSEPVRPSWFQRIIATLKKWTNWKQSK